MTRAETNGQTMLQCARSRDLVEAHGGTVVGQSPGKNGGSTFVVTLPVHVRKTKPEKVQR